MGKTKLTMFNCRCIRKYEISKVFDFSKGELINKEACSCIRPPIWANFECIEMALEVKSTLSNLTSVDPFPANTIDIWKQHPSITIPHILFFVPSKAFTKRLDTSCLALPKETYKETKGLVIKCILLFWMDQYYSIRFF